MVNVNDCDWVVVEIRTQKIMGTYATSRKARTRANALDMAYGAIGYVIKPLNRETEMVKRTGKDEFEAWKISMCPNTVAGKDNASIIETHMRYTPYSEDYYDKVMRNVYENLAIVDN